MKKLALALMCLVGVASFASCDPEVIENPEPSISILAEDGYLTDGLVIDMNVEYPYGFVTASNPLTMKNLTRLVIVCGDVTLCDTAISGTEFTYRGSIYFSDSKEIFDSAEIIATVYDEAGKTNSASIKVDINKEESLVVTPVEWTKWGHTVEDLSAYGLEMQANNWKSPFVHIYPAENCTLYVIENDSEDWFEAIETASNLAGVFQMLYEDPEVTACTDYKNIDCNASARYDDVLVTKDAEGNYHAIHITGTSVAVVAPNGTKITISAVVK